MHLVLAAILLGIPSSTPTLDPFDTPDSDATAPPAAAQPASALVRDHTTSVPAAVPAASAPAARISPTTDTPHPSTRPTPGRTTEPVPARTRHPARTPPPAHTRTTTAPTRRPAGRPAATPHRTRPATPTDDDPPATTPKPKHTPPGQTREPPGQATRRTPPGQPKQPPGQAADKAHGPKDHPLGDAGHPGERLDGPNSAQRGNAMSDSSAEGLSAAVPSPRCGRGCR
ncbi:hypothetical protein ACIBQX_49195 [Nonomuraea sp. NPDC049714]|uniref:hypothetical protein n=1 Tax=Nonomuraea sp. NPDC049714 TaxID=3364357 RepID=UPI00378F9B9A